jgi:hypothetical protein
VMNVLNTTAPKKAPIAPGTASGQTFDQSTFPNRQWDAPDAAVVPTSAMCTLADARAGAMPTVNNRLCDVTPYAIPSDPSTNCAMSPTTAKIRKFATYPIPPLFILSTIPTLSTISV